MTQPGPGDFTNPGEASSFGYGSFGYTGSYEEWFDRVVADLITRYKTGQGGSGWAAAGFSTAYGSPDPADFNNPDGTLSPRTVQFIENFVRNEGATSNYILSAFGPPPTQHVQYAPDPNSPASIQDDAQEFTAEQNALDRELEWNMFQEDAAIRREQIAANLQIAAMQEAGATERVRMQIEASWAEAQLAAATQKYIAEGDWAVQKWVTTENNKAAMERLQAQLAFDREALAQQALAEKNRHHETMIALALEVAKYDAELAASPRNWLKYAAWLQNRDVVVDGMTLAMAAQEVPEQAIEPAEVFEATGDAVAGIEALVERQGMVDGTSGGSSKEVTAEQMRAMLEGQGQQVQQAIQSGTLPQGAQQQQGQLAQRTGASLGVEELEGVTDYSNLVDQLLGSNPLAGKSSEAITADLQAIADSLSTAGNKRSGFGAYGGPTTNAQGVQINEVAGKDVDYRSLMKMLPSEQEAKFGSIESVRGPYGVADWLAEVERSRPKGQTQGATAYG